MYKFMFLICLTCLEASGGVQSRITGDQSSPETVQFMSGSLRLQGLIFQPTSGDRHAAVLFLHGAGSAGQDFRPAISAVGASYASHGYVLFAPYRRGQGLSAGQGEAIGDRLNREEQAHGVEARMRLLAELSWTEQMDDVLAALEYLRARPDVDQNRIAVAGNSLGGTLAVFSAERALGIRAVISSATAAQSWATSPELRERLLSTVRNARVPILFFQAENDYDLAPTERLSSEMKRASKPFVRKIYPAFGKTNADGHSFGTLGGTQWGPDVFAFLDMHLGSK